MNIIPIKTNNSKGYDIAEDGDTIDTAYPDSNTRRGRVAHQLSHTLTQNDNEQVVVLGNYHQSNHEASRIVSSDGLSPTVKENHGTVNAVVESLKLICDECIHEKVCEWYGFYNAKNKNAAECDDFFIKQPMPVDEQNKCIRTDGTVGTLTTDGSSPKHNNRIIEPRCEQETQIYPNSGNPQAGRIYNANGISPALDTCEGGNRMPKITEPKCIGCVGEKWGTQYHQQDRIYEGDIAMCHPANIPGGSYMYKIEELCVDESVKPSVRNNFINEYEEIKQSNKDIYQCKCDSGWQDNKIGLKMSPTIRSENDNTFAGYYSHNGFRVRKLTPKECWRLMGFSDEDFDKASEVNSNSQLHKQAGNSIVVNVLESIFEEMIP